MKFYVIIVGETCKIIAMDSAWQSILVCRLIFSTTSNMCRLIYVTLLTRPKNREYI